MFSDGDWRIQRLRERLKTRVIGFSEIKDIQGSEFLFLNLNTPEGIERQSKLKRCVSNRPFLDRDNLTAMPGWKDQLSGRPSRPKELETVLIC